METTATALSLSPTVNICNNECINSDSDVYHLDPALENSYIENMSEPTSLVTESNERANCEKEIFKFNEIPEPIQALDDILSEFEEPDSLPPTINNASSFHENHSEDDGYMSLNGRRCEVNSEICVHKNSRTTINSKLEDTSEPSLIIGQEELQSKDLANITESSDVLDTDLSIIDEQPSSIVQNTLPKSRSAVSNKGNYSSLPCASLRSSALENKLRVGSCSGDRNILGIDISAVHNAVLRGGVAKLPEPIVNEHPVTIYPGRASPPSGANWNARQNLACSVQSYKEVCRKINIHNWSNKLPSFPPRSQLVSLKVDESFENVTLKNKMSPKEFQIVKDFTAEITESSEEFSDDSLEGATGQNFLVENFTFSAPVTPHKRSGIAWEIKFKNNRHIELRKSRTSHNIKRKSPKKNEVYEQRNASLKGNKRSASPECCVEFFSDKFQIQDIFKQQNDSHKSDCVMVSQNHETFAEMDDCSVFPLLDGSMLGKGTFIIRKRPKDRVPGSEINDLLSPSTMEYKNGYVSNVRDEQSNFEKENPKVHGVPAFKNLTRTRLSLNLESGHSATDQNILIKQQSRNTASETFVSGNSHIPLNQGHGLCNFNSTSIYKTTQEDLSQLQSCPDVIKSLSPSSSLEKSKKICDSFQPNMKTTNGLRSPGSNEHLSSCTTPHRELAPPLEEEEEQCSESQSGCAPLRQIEHNISALLRGDIAVARICGENPHSRRSLGYRPGVHKSESAKEMLLSQNAFGPLPPSPPSSSSELIDCDELPPLPPSPTGTDIDDNILDSEFISTTVEMHLSPLSVEESQSNAKLSKYLLNDLPLPPTPKENLPPAVPPHRGTLQTHTMRSRSIDSNYTRKCPKTISHSGSSVLSMGYGTSACDVAYTSRRVIGSYGLKRNLKQSPREEHRLQTSCSLPETPIFARGCDIARTPHRRQTEYAVGSGSRTAPRTGASQTPNMGSSIVGISGGNTLGIGVCRQRTLSHALASGEMLRLSGGPARGWYPKQRSMRPASTENIDRLPTSHTASMRIWDSAGGMAGTGQVRKPLTLPPNLTPSFLNKSPREALRRVTSLLINKKGSSKDRDNKISKENMALTALGSNNGVGSIGKPTLQEQSSKQCHSSQKSQKKKGFFKQFWKKSKHYSLDQ